MPSEVATMAAWLDQHRSGWRPVLATSPTPTAEILLDAAGQRDAIALRFWPGPKYPGWHRSVLLYSPAGEPQGVQNFSVEELAPLFTLAR